jgi:NADH dehydrogenase FAD-containing subunit
MHCQALRNLQYRSERHAAEMIAEDASGNPRTASPYLDKGDMAVIGRHLAVADVRRPFHARWSGYPGMSRVASYSFASSGCLIDIRVVIAGCR